MDLTNPGDPQNFSYTDDSVVARLSFDVPAQALTDVNQLTAALSAMATQQEYIARSTGSWLEYMQQVPQISERANQSYRESITQLERMSYIQNEMGNGKANVGTEGAAGPGYSTAAPSGYINPFSGISAGMGVTPDLTSVEQHMQGMAMQDPRMYANIAAARGNAVNPALMGMMGGATAVAMGGQGGAQTGGGLGWGAAAPGSMSSQSTQSARDSAAPPDASQGGQSTRSEPQNVPGNPHPDSPAWVQTAAQIMNEAASASGSRPSQGLSMGSRALGAAGRFAENHPDALGSIGSKLGGLGKAAGLLGMGAVGLGIAQNVGEKATQYAQLGSVQGGAAGEGVSYEAQARIMALNPFITTEQARQVMQTALREGFRGGDFDTVQGFMVKNFKDMGMSIGDSMQLIQSSVVKGGDATKSFDENMQSLKDTLSLTKDLAKQGGASLPDREKQLQATTDTLTSMNVSGEAAGRASTYIQEAFADNKVLRDAAPGVMDSALSNPLFLQQIANDNGISGLPGAIPGKLEDAGVNLGEEFMKKAKMIAMQVKGSYRDDRDGAAAFQSQMALMGAQMDQKTAFELYKELTGGRDISGDVQKKLKTADDSHHKSGWDKFFSMDGFKFDGAFPTFGNDVPSAGDHNGDKPQDVIGSLERNRPNTQADSFAPSGRPRPAETAGSSAPQTINTQGSIQGTLNITVDQNGKVSAPQQIQLSGQQKSANAGYGNAQLNNAPPGDPSFGHSYNGFG